MAPEDALPKQKSCILQQSCSSLPLQTQSVNDLHTFMQPIKRNMEEETQYCNPNKHSDTHDEIRGIDLPLAPMSFFKN